MKKISFFIVSLFILSAAASTAFAAPMEARIYFTKPTALAPATYTLRFSLWNISAKGTPANNRVWWEEKDLAITDATLSTYLGDVTDPAKRSGALGNVDFSEQYWVQVERLDTDGVTYKPMGRRTVLSVVPYAMWSETAGSGGSVRSVTAGAGLTGSNVNGDITLDIGAGPGISVGANNIYIATGAVSSSMLAAGAATSEKIATGAVGNSQLASGAVTSDKIAAGAVGNNQIANSAVTSDKIAAGAVGNSQLASGAVTFSKIGTSCPNGNHPTYSTGTGWVCGVGTPGANGKTILNGAVNPTGSVGTDGDFYINTTTSTLFGPKSGGVWPSGLSLITPPVTTSATCSSFVYPRNGDCSCSRTTISKVISYSTCTATSDTGSCTATGGSGFGSCCVCTY